jgi:hypothetical protein
MPSQSSTAQVPRDKMLSKRYRSRRRKSLTPDQNETARHRRCEPPVVPSAQVCPIERRVADTTTPLGTFASRRQLRQGWTTP